ncbi:SOS response-associated peptidase [Thiorhodococcus mannitoliphagus]|uniref:Abasic site processing protein n=1 Tax=Thiorhodococcus mannitoliphagus TaxID=329406 RepID=A0A6P1DWX0_9GAMM|nr:SOS response-associated peptidase [Thiorhodococcus mannitoliphagus]NEX22807.1 SOS response-associated peptidase [Thiorhodococcus mannitoliphagus]
MCGRFAQFSLPEALEAYFDVADGYDFPPPRYNIAPGSQILALRGGTHGRPNFVSLHWGLIPSWAKDRKFGYRTINARAETVAEKPSFRDAFKSRRCLIPADGFYEWKATPDGKQPYFIRLKDQSPMAFAGLWESWTDRETGEVVLSGTIIVTQANDLVRQIHDRMPVILGPGEFPAWLDPSAKAEPRLQGLLRPIDPAQLVIHPVDRRVGKPTNEDPSLILPLAAG